MSSPDALVLREGRIELHEFSDELAAALVRARIAQVSPRGGGFWEVSTVARVGGVVLVGREVRIEPKVPIRNLFHLLSRGNSWGHWWSDDLLVGDSPDLYEVIAEAFAAHAERALRAGVLRDYVARQSAELTVRGRVLIGDQLRRRAGLPLPVEIGFDDFTADIPVNRLVRSAARRLVASGRLPARLRERLLGLDRALSDADLLTRGTALPEVHWDRRSERYRAAVSLATLILTNGSLDHRVGGTVAKGFLLTLSTVFEQFVEAEVRRAAAPYGGRIVAQDRVPLDEAGRLHIEPDLVWRDGDRVRAVLDAKYKAERPSGFPNADIYQMLVYCARHRLSTGHLVYAAGNEDPARYEVRGSNVTVVCHALRLDQTPAEISAQVDRIVATVAADAASDAIRAHRPRGSNP